MIGVFQNQSDTSPENWQDNSWMIGATLRQVEKDFRLQAVQLELRKAGTSYAELVDVLATKLEDLEFVHHSRFVPILYQIDLPQKELTAKIDESKPEDIYHMLADLILKRCFEKIYWRRRMKEEYS